MESLQVNQEADKHQKYEQLLPQLQSLIQGEPDTIANLANIIAALKETFAFFWIGIYFVKEGKNGKELVLGPFQGPIACTRIQLGKGVCGTAWAKKETILVPDVDLFPGHIACSSLSRSEIVVPVLKNGEVIAVLDVDSEFVSHFDEADQKYLEKIVLLIASVL
ncbi:MAG: GAF domain-containing protein [Bacteroidia bacterium]